MASDLPVELALVDSHAYDNGVMSLTYKPTGTSATDSAVREALRPVAVA
jgi:hypothetical protein